MKKISAWLFTTLLIGVALAASAAAAAADLKYGLYIHYGMDTFRNAGEKGQLPVKRFAPAKVDVQAWARAAKDAGMTFAVLTAKHESGFCLWSSRSTKYDIAHSPFKGDLMGDFIAACKAEGLLPGVHYSIPDVLNEGAVRYKGEVPQSYFEVIKQHLGELFSQYSDLRLLIVDSMPRLSPSQSDELKQIVQRLNPACVVWSNGGGNQGQSHKVATVIKSWMWSANAPFNASGQLFNQYRQSQAAGRAFVLNVGPMPSGEIPENQLAVLAELKALIANPPAAGPASGAGGGKAPAAERLKQLKQLLEQGLISKEDHDKKVKEIVDSL